MKFTHEQFERTFGKSGELAEKLNIPHATVRTWKLRGQIPYSKVLLVERVTSVPRWLIRPDIYPREDSKCSA